MLQWCQQPWSSTLLHLAPRTHFYSALRLLPARELLLMLVHASAGLLLQQTVIAVPQAQTLTYAVQQQSF
jgi:hypothetical protein